jgi:uncharacterized membrane protein YheB (UPF0754 family)
VKVAVFGITGSHLVLPIFGLITGGLTDDVALTMIFRPKQSRAIAPGIRWQSLFHAKRDQVTRDYAKLLAKDILTPAVIMESLLSGALSPISERRAAAPGRGRSRPARPERVCSTD